jgi:hypothetical protein
MQDGDNTDGECPDASNESSKETKICLYSILADHDSNDSDDDRNLQRLNFTPQLCNMLVPANHHKAVGAQHLY